MNYRKVKFQYFQVFSQVTGEIPKLFDLKQWISQMATTSLENRAKEYNGESARLEEAYFADDYDFYFLHFVRLRATNIPSRAKLDTNVEPMELGDDEYLGEEVSALYDESRNILMLQRNKYSLSPTGIEDYLNLAWGKDETISLRAISVPDPFILARRPAIYRKINLRLANVTQATERGVLGKLNSKLSQIVDSFGALNSVNAQITITMGTKKEENLNEKEVGLILSDIEENPELFSGAEVAVKESDEGKVELIDLLNNLAHDYATFRMEARTTLNHYSIAEAMYIKYHPQKDNRQAEVTTYLR